MLRKKYWNILYCNQCCKFLIKWYDKHEAKVGGLRVKESTLFGFALFGGKIGGLIGMKVFHHKTKKWNENRLSSNNYNTNNFSWIFTL